MIDKMIIRMNFSDYYRQDTTGLIGSHDGNEIRDVEAVIFASVRHKRKPSLPSKSQPRETSCLPCDNKTQVATSCNVDAASARYVDAST